MTSYIEEGSPGDPTRHPGNTTGRGVPRHPGLGMTKGAEMPSQNCVIGCRNVAIQFGHVQALRGATVIVPSGKVVALVGDNGAGKSTLLKTLLGINRPDSGQVIIGGQSVSLHSVRDAQALGVEAVHQDLALAPDLSVVDNMFLGHEKLVD